MKLTDIALRALMKAGKPTAKADGQGLTFTLSAGGTASWVLRYRSGGKQKELTLGRYPDIGLSEARQRASAERAKIQAGVDVAQVKQDELRRKQSAQTVSELVEDWREKVLPRYAQHTQRHRERHLRCYILPRLGSKLIEDVKPADIADLFRHVGKVSTTHTATLCSITTNALFKHAMAQALTSGNPCMGVQVGAIVGQHKPTKARLMLNDGELATLLKACGTDGNGLAIRILLATAVRHGELFKARWEHIDLEAGLWRIPAENSKTRQSFTQPLPPVVVGWFRELLTQAKGSEWVQPSRMRGKRGQHVDGTTLGLAITKLCKQIGMRRFTAHDLRSTCRSHLSAMGVAIPVAERILNHSLGGMLAIYDQHDMIDDRRHALGRWADKLHRLESGEGIPDNVVQLRAAETA